MNRSGRMLVHSHARAMPSQAAFFVQVESASAIHDRYRLGLIACLGFFLRIPTLMHDGYWLIDEPSWRILGNLMNNGQILYRDIVVQLPPLMLFIYSWIARLSDPWISSSVYLFGAAWAMLTTLALGSAFFVIGARKAGLAAAFLYAIFSTFYRGSEFLSVNGELIANGFYALAFLFFALFLKNEKENRHPVQQLWPLFIMGSCAALAAAVKSQSGVLFLAAVLYFCLRPIVSPQLRKRFGQALAWPLTALCCGFLLPVAALAIYFFLHDAFAQALHFVLENQMIHAAEHNHYSFAYFFLKLILRCFQIGLPAWPLWLLAALSLRTLLKSGDVKNLSHQMMFFAAITVLATWIPTSLGARFLPHYFVLFLTPLSVLAAPTAARLLISSQWAYGWRSRLRQVIVGFCFVSSLVWFGINLSGYSKFNENIPDTLKAHILQTSRSDDAIFIWGYAPQWYLDVRRNPFAGFYSLKQLVGAKHGSKGMFLDANASALDRLRADIKGGRDRRVPNDPHYISEVAWRIFERRWKEAPPSLFIDTSPIGFRGYDFPARSIPRMATLLEDYSAPIEIDGMQVFHRKASEKLSTTPTISFEWTKNRLEEKRDKEIN